MIDTQSDLLSCALCGSPAPAGVTVMDHCPVCEDPSVDLRALPTGFTLESGGHDAFEEGACLLEAVAYVAGEEHSHAPRCVSPSLACIGVELNDGLADDERQLLVPFIPRLIGTATTLEHDRVRDRVFIDAVVHDVLPLALDAVGWRDLAESVRAIPPIVDDLTFDAANDVLSSVDETAGLRWRAEGSSDGREAAMQAAENAYVSTVIQPTADDAVRAACHAIDAAPGDDERRRIVDATLRAFARAIDTPAPELAANDAPSASCGLDELAIDPDATPESIRAESEDDVARQLAEELTR